MIILCDFDGTVTERTVSELLWGRSHPSTEQHRGQDRTVSGQWKIRHDVSRSITPAHATPETALPTLLSSIRIRDGFEAFVNGVRRQRDCMHLLSNGIEHFVSELLPAGLAFSTPVENYDQDFAPSSSRTFPLRAASHWKTRRVSELLREHVGERSVYVGNGSADIAAARLCQRIYAVQGSRLAEMCRTTKRPVREFESFHEIVDELYNAGSSECRASA